MTVEPAGIFGEKHAKVCWLPGGNTNWSCQWLPSTDVTGLGFVPSCRNQPSICCCCIGSPGEEDKSCLLCSNSTCTGSSDPRKCPLGREGSLAGIELRLVRIFVPGPSTRQVRGPLADTQILVVSNTNARHMPPLRRLLELCHFL